MSSAFFAAARLGTAALMLPAMLALHALLQSTTDPLEPDQRIFHAVSLRDPLLMRHALEDKVSCDARDGMGSTPLQYCALVGDVRMMQQLLDAGADVNARNNLGLTALMMASTTNQVMAVDLLLRHGADPSLTAMNEGLTALDVAELNESWESAALLRNQVGACDDDARVDLSVAN